jgi:hypothetical protein
MSIVPSVDGNRSISKISDRGREGERERWGERE